VRGERVAERGHPAAAVAHTVLHRRGAERAAVQGPADDALRPGRAQAVAAAAGTDEDLLAACEIGRCGRPAAPARAARGDECRGREGEQGEPGDGHAGEHKAGARRSYDLPVELLERERHLAALEAARVAGGRFVLIAGEAGIGKTSLVEELLRRVDRGRVLHGACDPLETPRPLGPLFDIAYETGGPLLEALTGDAPRESVFRAALDELATGETIVLVEDAHWADGPTLDWLRFVARRIRQVGATLVVTYRPGESESLQRLLGQLATVPGIVRLEVEPLSRDAVEELAARRGRSGGEVYAAAGGNAFFVTELLASDAALPATVRDAVLARAASLSPPARAVIDAASVLGAAADAPLLGRVAPGSARELDEAAAPSEPRSRAQQTLGPAHARHIGRATHVAPPGY
jgi:AAA ATPase domain